MKQVGVWQQMLRSLQEQEGSRTLSEFWIAAWRNLLRPRTATMQRIGEGFKLILPALTVGG